MDRDPDAEVEVFEAEVGHGSPVGVRVPCHSEDDNHDGPYANGRRQEQTTAGMQRGLLG